MVNYRTSRETLKPMEIDARYFMDNYNMDAALEQLREREHSTLASVPEIRQNADKDINRLLDKVRLSSLTSLEAIDEIIERRRRKTGTSRT